MPAVKVFKLVADGRVVSTYKVPEQLQLVYSSENFEEMKDDFRG